MCWSLHGWSPSPQAVRSPDLFPHTAAPPLQITAGILSGTRASSFAAEKSCCGPAPVHPNLSPNTSETHYCPHTAVRFAAPMGCRTKSQSTNILPLPPGRWADGRTAVDTGRMFLPRQRRSPVQRQFFAVNDLRAPDPLLSACVFSAAWTFPPLYSVFTAICILL